MRKILLIMAILLISCTTVFAAKIPDEVKSYIEKSVPGIDIRFDGVIIFPDNTIYLPLYPSLFSDVSSVKIKTTYPENTELSAKPDIVIFNNDFYCHTERSEVSQINCSGFFDCPSLIVHLRMTIAIVILIHYR